MSQGMVYVQSDMEYLMLHQGNCNLPHHVVYTASRLETASRHALMHALIICSELEWQWS